MYKMCSSLNMRRKFTATETHAKSLFERRSHLDDDTGEGDEGSLPPYCRLLFNISHMRRDVLTINLAPVLNAGGMLGSIDR